jgi:ankyrin repeat protein
MKVEFISEVMEQRNSSGVTALEHAIELRALHAVDVLLNAGLGVDLRSAWEFAWERNSYGTLAIIAKNAGWVFRLRSAEDPPTWV